MSKSGFSAGQLRAFIDRVERLEEEKAALAADIKEVYAEAKANGFCTKTMRKIIALRKLDTADRQEAEAMLDLYKGALGMDGTPLGDYDRLTSAVESAGPRVADVKAKLAEGESVDPETGEVTITDQQDDNVHLRVTVDERVAKVLSDAPRPSNRDVSTDGKPYPEACPQAEASHAGTGSGAPAVHEGHISEGAAYTDESVTVERHVNAAPPLDDIPAFLDRRSKARAAEMA